MIFAHGPGSFLTVYFTKKIWGKNISKKAQYILLGFGVFVGLALDFDLLYYFNISALKSHRETIGHSLVLHAIITLVLLLIALILKNKYLKAAAIVYGIAALTHLILDSFSAGVMWLYPFSEKLYGFLSFKWFSESFLSEYLFLISFALEVIIITVALLVFLKLIRSILGKTFYIAISIAVAVIGCILVLVVICHSFDTFRHTGNPFYGDIDNDKIVNRSDEDVDGDGLKNFSDPDANGNGISNVDEIVTLLPKFQGVRFDPSDGILYEIFDRLGFFDNKDIIYESFTASGLFIGQQMTQEAESLKSKYEGEVTESEFKNNLSNYYTFFENNATLVPEKSETLPGDIVFFGEKPNNSGIISENENGTILVVYVDPEHRGAEYLLEDVVSWSGEVRNIFRLP